MSKQMKTLLALIIVSMLTVLCACNSVAPPDRQNTPAEALSDNGNGDGLSSDFTDDSAGADVSETTSEESEITSGEGSDQSEPENSQPEFSVDDNKTNANTVDGDTAPVSELVLFVPAGSEDNKVGIRPPIEGSLIQLNMPRNLFADNDGTINIYDCDKKRIVSFRDGALVDEIDFDDYMYSAYCYSQLSTPSSDGYYAVAGDSEYIYLIGYYEFKDENNVYRSAVKICVINRSDKTGTIYTVMPESEKRTSVQSNYPIKLNGRVLISLYEADSDYCTWANAFATDSGLSIVDQDSVMRYSSEGAERTCYTIAGSSPVRFSTDRLPGDKYGDMTYGSVIAVTSRYLYFRTPVNEDQFTSYVYKVERSSGKIIGYVKHVLPNCRDWGYDYYVTDNDELYYMESVLSYDEEKCGTSVYKVTFGNDFESIKIRGSADASASSAAQTVSGSSVISNKRSDVESLANQMRNLQWTLKSQNKNAPSNKNPKTGNQLIPGYIYGEPVGTLITGIPYAFGGFTGLTTEYGMNTFISCVNAGDITGNISGDYYYPSYPQSNEKKFCAGLDCSGFVSTAYGISKTQSWNLASFGYSRSSIYDMKPYDLIVKSNLHCMLFLSVTGSGRNATVNYVDCTSLGTGKCDIRKTNVGWLKDNKFSFRTPWNPVCTYENPVSVNSTVHKKTCSDCGDTISENHTFGAATAGGGVRHSYTCTGCSYSYTEVHSYPSAYQYDATTHYKICTACGNKGLTANHTVDVYGRCTVCGYNTMIASVKS